MHYLFYKVDRTKISDIKSILEAYENIFAVSTVCREIPKLQITVAPDFLEDAKEILKDMQERFYMEQLDEDCTKSQGLY